MRRPDTEADKARARVRVKAWADKLKETPEGRARLAARNHTPKTIASRKAYQTAYYAKTKSDPSAWLSKAVMAAKSRAKKQGIPFDLQPSDVALPETCPVLGVRLRYGTARGKERPLDAASLDKIIPSRGYTAGNTRIISWRANRVKNAETDPAVFEALALDARRNGVQKEHD